MKEFQSQEFQSLVVKDLDYDQVCEAFNQIPAAVNAVDANNSIAFANQRTS